MYTRVHTHALLCVHACVLVSERESEGVITFAVVSGVSVHPYLRWTELMNDLFYCCWVNVYNFPKLVNCELISEPYCRINFTVLQPSMENKRENVIPVGKSHI
jgi:hypothetical protein